MQKNIQLRVKPEEAANASLLVSILAQAIGHEQSAISGYHILKQSIDARSRQQVWINLTILAFVNESPSNRFEEKLAFPTLPNNAKEVIIIGAGPAAVSYTHLTLPTNREV